MPLDPIILSISSAVFPRTTNIWVKIHKYGALKYDTVPSTSYGLYYLIFTTLNEVGDITISFYKWGNCDTGRLIAGKSKNFYFRTFALNY